MMILSVVLEDWAIHELIKSPRRRTLAVVLVASSYVTWTYQTHTFSNSVETLVVAWSLVMIQRIRDDKVRFITAFELRPAKLALFQQRSSFLSSALLGSLVTFGIFNRITFPAFVLLPGLYLMPHFLRKYVFLNSKPPFHAHTNHHMGSSRPFSFLALSLTTLMTTILAIIVDTAFYNSSSSLPLPWHLLHSPVITPLNSLVYNSSKANLSLHGLHPPYQHLLVSLPTLLGPSIFLLPLKNLSHAPLPLISAISATFLLSLIPHQEPRFLLPAVPLFLASIHLPNSRSAARYFLAAWIGFNAFFAILIGVYHQGGVVPVQIWLGTQHNSSMSEVFWWRTYSPPVWLLDGNRLQVTDLMGLDVKQMIARLETGLRDGCHQSVGLVAPRSRTELDYWTAGGKTTEEGGELVFEQVWTHTAHVGLDDLDFAGEGVRGTLERVVGRRGLTIWRVRRRCFPAVQKGSIADPQPELRD